MSILDPAIPPTVPDPAIAAAALADAAAADAAAAAAALEAAKPVVYDLKLTENSPLKPADLEKLTAFATAQKLAPELAAAVLKYQEETTGGLVNSQNEAVNAQKEAWKTEISTDLELGGPRLQATIDLSKRVMDRFSPQGSPFRTMLDETGYGNHPEWVRFINNIGKAMQEDKPLSDRGADGPAKKSHADILFGPTT